jgi:hypothetical protein
MFSKDNFFVWEMEDKNGFFLFGWFLEPEKNL